MNHPINCPLNMDGLWMISFQPLHRGVSRRHPLSLRSSSSRAPRKSQARNMLADVLTAGNGEFDSDFTSKNGGFIGIYPSTIGISWGFTGNQWDFMGI